jgi:hypothetical protein
VELTDGGIGTKLFSFVKSIISMDSCDGFEQTSKDMKIIQMKVMVGCAQTSRNEEERRKSVADGKLDLTDTIKDGAQVVATDAALRQQLLMAFTEDSRLHVREVQILVFILLTMISNHKAINYARMKCRKSMS